ncbi:hypothetical protein NX059_002482 [Plenodomus lindquistii]|nr:hypothetical protein NX059_002482 [Plenodomus lindquistii]
MPFIVTSDVKHEILVVPVPNLCAISKSKAMSHSCTPGTVIISAWKAYHIDQRESILRIGLAKPQAGNHNRHRPNRPHDVLVALQQARTKPRAKPLGSVFIDGLVALNGITD